ncbi:NmrA family NAD(P)-binding protein [candidate division KSB1 bacterium]|nr:NmrA family NAD(P)-binding protein [candidate division KSB1 bacterium]
MPERKLIAVTGATGAQGGGLVRAILADKSGQWTVRAITRKLDSDKAKALAAAGVEVVAADLDDVDSLTKAFAGAHGVFCVTNYWEHFSVEKEMQQAKNLAAAAKLAGVQHAIWSTLEDTRALVPLSDTRMPTLHEKYKVPHFDGKGESNRFFSDAGVPTTWLNTSFYWENFIHFGMGPMRGPDGVLGITMPMGDTKLPGIAAEDIGKCAFGIFKKGHEFIGKTVGIAGEHLTGNEMASALTRAIGQPIRYHDVPADVYRGFGFPGADDVGNMFQYKRDFNADFVGGRNLGLARSLNPELQSFETWLKSNAANIPLPQ